VRRLTAADALVYLTIGHLLAPKVGGMLDVDARGTSKPPKKACTEIA